MARHPADLNSGSPLVAVTATVRTDDGRARIRLNSTYLEILERAGLTPVVIPPFHGDAAAVEAAVDSVLDAVAGLVITGGEDVEPARYGATPGAHLDAVNTARDATEIAAVMGAHERRMPLLAICRGIQILNVAFGGTLIQDLPTECPGPITHDPDRPRDSRTHVVQLVSGSRAAAATDATRLDVNSSHHQAVARVGKNLVVTATAPDGVIEGLETDPLDPWWAVGVQWHPEEFVADHQAPDYGLFAAFAAAVDRATAGLVP
jgi:putative glutamine amidotransferase